MNGSDLIKVLFVVYLLGTLVNGVVLWAFAGNPSQFLKSRADKIQCALVATCGIWSLGRVVIEILLWKSAIDLSNKGAAAFSNFVLATLFMLNLNLAMERYFQIRETPYADRMFHAFNCTLGVVYVLIVVIFATSPSTDGVQPDYSIQRLIWGGIIILTYFVSVGLMIYLYVSTYLYSSRQFKAHPGLVRFFINNSANKIIDEETIEMARMNVDRQILRKCILLSSSLLFCYLPFFIYQLLNAIWGYQTFDPYNTFYYVAVIWMVTDVLVTPVLVCQFKSDLQKTILFWKR